MSTKKERIKVYEMTCTSCEGRVEKAIKGIGGVKSVKTNYAEQYADVEYDDPLCNISKIKTAIRNAGYGTQSSNDYKLMGIVIIFAAIILLGLKTSGFDMEAKLSNASYAVLFIVGVLTSIHCVGMCGGIMLSQSIGKESNNKLEAIKPALLYNLGRVIAYTILGGIIGALGSVFSLSVGTKAFLQIFAGAFMIIMGFNMAGFKAFRKFSIKLPSAMCRFKAKSGSSFVVGLLNGFMPCGPLQTMQLFALGTGSAAKGALSMFMFSIGTVPLMLTFGALSGLLSKSYSKKILKFSGVLVITLGFIMGSRGFALAGINVNPLRSLMGSFSASTSNASKAIIEDGVQVIRMTADNNGYTPNAFYVQKGMPVKWIIDGKQLNSCNNAIVANSISIEKKLKSGENIVEFTPGDTDINFSCWMGMISGVIKVVDDLGTVDTSKADPSLPPSGSGPSCCQAPIAGSTPSEPSIYGDDLSSVTTDKLVSKAQSIGNTQIVKFKGIGYELQPLIVVAENTAKTTLTLDLKDFKNVEGEYLIIDAATGETVKTFTAKKDLNEIEFSPSKAGGYGIVKGDSVLGIIEVVDNLKASNLEEIRAKYLP